ncbi:MULTISPECIES: DUF2905 domain-containing protein [Pseudomonadaceae]|uniref:DUF2905 domain-containing protein n=2 Tax=Pseudomonadales TaxID=72274 RepID=UPI00210E9E2D|nr:DUF2905 domain-containing protein [Pseudomonas sp. 10B238]
MTRTGGNMAKWLIVAGLLLLLLGVVFHYAPGLLSWFGKLPGDIRIESERSRTFIPITSMIILSVALTVLLNIFFRR